MDYKEQGLAIRGARLERRMTQAHLAGMAGVSEKTVRRAEGGDRLQADSIRAVCAALGLDASQLRTEAELRPDVAAEINSALVGQAVRVRLLTRTFAVSCLATGVFLGFGDEPFAWVVGKWVFMALLMTAFSTPLANLILLPMKDKSVRARKGLAWLKSRQWAVNGMVAAAFMPMLLLGTAALITAAIRDRDWYEAGFAVAMVLIVWSQANTAANEMLDLEGDPVATGVGSLKNRFDAVVSAALTAFLLATVLPVIKWVFPRLPREDAGES